MTSESKAKDRVEESHFSGEPEEIELYGDPGIATYDAKVPAFLKWTYLLLPIWGVIFLYVFWNGSLGGWLDPGYWRELQIAANTTLPMHNVNMPSPKENHSPYAKEADE